MVNTFYNILSYPSRKEAYYMKKSKAPSGLTAIFVMIIAIQVSISGPFRGPQIVTPEPPPPIEELLPQGDRADIDLKLRILLGDHINEITMEQYLIGVVAAEMPASFELEALKAQAVAARTNALYSMLVLQKPRHPDAHVCSDFTCCTAYSNDERLRERWGYDYVRNITGIITAVTETDGIFLSYDDQPIIASFHSSSARRTESSVNVWMSALPYLRSVSSPETELQVPNYVADVTVSLEDFIDIILSAYPDAVLDGVEESWITDVTHTESGRIYELVIGGVPVRGTAIRSLFDLRSTAIMFKWIPSDGITFTTTGFGHGVGMSQYGANAMAADGSDYSEILLHYYTGATFGAF